MKGFKPDELRKIFHNDGWIEVKGKGSHIKFFHPQSNITISLPLGHKKEVSRPLTHRLLKQAKNNNINTYD